jgi:hypothetical protein
VSDLRQVLISAGCNEAAVDRVLGELDPVAAAIERTRGHVDIELAWALIGVAADQARRRAQPCRPVRRLAATA